jgi:DNA polymerase III psi subunit
VKNCQLYIKRFDIVKWLLLMIMYLYCETIVVDDKVRLLIVDNVLTTIENVLEKLVVPVISD